MLNQVTVRTDLLSDLDLDSLLSKSLMQNRLRIMASDPLDTDQHVVAASTQDAIASSLNPIHNLAFSRVTTIFEQSPGRFTHVVVPTVTLDDSPAPSNTAGGFDYFATISPEIRAKILEFLIGDTLINIDATKLPTVLVYRLRQARSTSVLGSVGGLRPALLGDSGASTYTRGAGNNWLTISKRFFDEARAELWRSVPIRFERRYDMIMAFINRSLHADADDSAPTGLNNLSMCPVETNVFQRIACLQLNLTSSTDFQGVVNSNEAKRVTQVIFNIAKKNMPALRNLVLFLDKESRVHDNSFVLLPTGWFIKGLLSIKQLKAMKLYPGPDFSGLGDIKPVAQLCIRVLNEVFQNHFEEDVDRNRLGWKTRTGSALQAKVGQRMTFILEDMCAGCPCQDPKNQRKSSPICLDCKTARTARDRFHNFYHVSVDNL